MSQMVLMLTCGLRDLSITCRPAKKLGLGTFLGSFLLCTNVLTITTICIRVQRSIWCQGSVVPSPGHSEL